MALPVLADTARDMRLLPDSASEESHLPTTDIPKIKWESRSFLGYFSGNGDRGTRRARRKAVMLDSDRTSKSRVARPQCGEN